MIAVFQGRGIISSRIRFWSWSQWTHVGVLDACEVARAAIASGRMSDDDALKLMCIVEAHYGEGVQENPSLLSANSRAARVELYDVPGATPQQWASVVRLMRSQIGHPYDAKGVMRFIPFMRWMAPKPPSWDDYRNPPAGFPWFCSELVSWAWWRSGLELFDSAPCYKIEPNHIRWSPLTRLKRTIEVTSRRVA